MLFALPASITALLERYLTYGTSQASSEVKLIVRRGRGFSLIGVLVLFGSALSALVHGMPDVALLIAVLMAAIVGGIALGLMQGARFIKPITHLGMGASLLAIVSSSMRVGHNNEISVTFPILLILVTNYVLGLRAAIFWTGASIAGMGIAVFTSQLPQSAIEDATMSLPGVFVTRALVLIAVCAVASVERRFADRQSAELAYLVQHDTLTGLYTRRAFEDRLADAIARAKRYKRRLALIVIDLDGFKAINDRYGHAGGDELLRVLGRRIAERTRSTDAASRMGGDEFLLLLEDISEQKNVEFFAEQLLLAITEPAKIGEAVVEVGASVGVAIYPECAEDAEGVTRAADLAMYAAKAGGGNAVQFHAGEIPGF